MQNPIKLFRRDKVYVYQGNNQDWYWHRKSGWNGKILSDGGQGYAFKSTAHEAARKRNPDARIFVNGIEQHYER